MAIIPKNHCLRDVDKVPVSTLCNEPFMLLEKGAKAEISEISLVKKLYSVDCCRVF